MLGLQESTGNARGLNTKAGSPRGELIPELWLPWLLPVSETQRLGFYSHEGRPRLGFAKWKFGSKTLVKVKTAELQPPDKCGPEIFALAKGGDKNT